MTPPSAAAPPAPAIKAAVAALLACGVLSASGCAASAGDAVGQQSTRPEPTAALVGAAATVVEVVDGDTVVVDIADQTERVRLIGIDTPEVDGGFLPAECYGEEASAFTKSLLPVGTEVRLTRDAEARDRYSRLLAYIHRTDDGLFVNLEIAVRGYAEALVIEPNTMHAPAFYRAASTARDRGLGLWGACGSADVVLP